MRTAIIGGAVLSGNRFESETSVLIEDGRILGLGLPVGDETVIEARGLLVLPGIVDLHADAIERAIEPRPGVRLPMPLALAEHDSWLIANGITTCFVSLTDGFEPGVRSRAAVRVVADALRDHAGWLSARVPLHLRREVCADGDPGELEEWIRSGRIGLLSINDHLPIGDDPVHEQRFLASLRRRHQGSGLDIELLIAEARSRRGEGSSICDRLCTTAVTHAVTVASHDDATPEDVEASVARGTTVCEFPGDLATARRARSLGATVLMGAPNVVRGASHVGLLRAAEAVAAGACDALCSDYHHPCLFQAPFALAVRSSCTLAEAWNLVSRSPAAAVGLHDRGRIAPGALADLVIVESGTLPRVRSTLVGGREVYRRG
jgi:alpha-D-ribose 1-methylphosphonate 5-triphosphate diphosphatase